MTVLLFNNNGFQCIHNLQREHGSDGFGNEFRYRESESGRLTGDYMPMDFAAHARSMGAKSYRRRRQTAGTSTPRCEERNSEYVD